MPSAYVLSEALAAAEQELALQWMPLFFDSEAYRERQEKRRALLERPPTVQMGDERLATAARDGVGSFSEALATQQQALRVSDSQRLSQVGSVVGSAGCLTEREQCTCRQVRPLVWVVTLTLPILDASQAARGDTAV
eukprot:m.409948 g.409948  ORF g.409948 m.409948 type:complete len:137 (-) comp20155_c2_seq36:2150-2560(-)